MILVLGSFLYNTFCAIVPCNPMHEPPRPHSILVPFPIVHHSNIPHSEFATASSNDPSSRSVHRSHRHQYAHHVPPVAPEINLHGGSSSSTVKIPILKSPYVVATQSGKVEGFPMKTIRSRDIIAFTKIPYAEKPIGHLRYRVSDLNFIDLNGM